MYSFTSFFYTTAPKGAPAALFRSLGADTSQSARILQQTPFAADYTV
jgi:hypothetical protein